MTAAPAEGRIQAPPPRELVAEEVRALLGRRRMNGVTLAARIGRSQSYVSRRLTGETAFDVDDLYRIAAALGVEPASLLRRASEPTHEKVGGTPVAHAVDVRSPRPHAPGSGAHSRPRSERARRVGPGVYAGDARQDPFLRDAA